MAYELRFSDSAGREFDTLDAPMQERIQGFLTTAAATADPSKHFARLHGDICTATENGAKAMCA